MQRILFILYFIVVFVHCNAQKSNDKSARPNSILIVTDDHKADALSFLGHKYVTTPNLDKLASQGFFFKNALCTTPICAASRASILTGTYERNHKYTFETGSLEDALVENVIRLELKNESTLPINKMVVEVPFSQLVGLDTDNLMVIDTKTNQEVTYQIESYEIKKMLLLVSIPVGKSIILDFKKGTKKDFRQLTFCRQVPERLDDFAWENDKIAFRMYGKALEGTKGDAYGIDVWVKRTDSLIINKRYAHGDYHNDRGDGLDYYHVGKTLGAGNIAPIVGDKIYYSGNYDSYEILCNGPIRTRFRLKYKSWDVAGKNVGVTKEITLDAGSQFNKIKTIYAFESDTLPLVIGVIKREGNHSLVNHNEGGIFAYWEPSFKKDGTTGVGIIVPGGFDKFSHTDEQYLMQTRQLKNKSFTYYQGAAWNKAKQITNIIDWVNYVSFYANFIDKGITIKKLN